MLPKRPRFVGELVNALNISRPGVSKHLRVLRDVGEEGMNESYDRLTDLLAQQSPAAG